jgi:hypothetical protein
LPIKDSVSSSLTDVPSSPLAAFVAAENTLALRLIQTVHQSLAAMNRFLKSGMPLPFSLMESAVEITLMKVDFQITKKQRCLIFFLFKK